MKRIPILLLAFALLAIVTAPVPARAANDDFSVDFMFSPNRIGPGGAELNLVVEVTNLGDSPIGWVEIIADTEDFFDELWITAIEPGTKQWTMYPIQFSEHDAEAWKTLTVCISNDASTPGPDGVQEFPFFVQSKDVFGVQESYAPVKPVYHPGDTVTFSYSYTNQFSFDVGDVVSVKQLGRSDVGPTFYPPEVEFGAVSPGETIRTGYSYTFTEDDVGQVFAVGWLDFFMNGRLAGQSGQTMVFTVMSNEVVVPDISFSASLMANPGLAEKGDTVDFTVIIKNTGEDWIDEYSLLNDEGGVIETVAGTAPGGTAAITVSVPVFETYTVSYVIEGRVSGATKIRETNSVTVTVTEPEASAEATPAPVATSAQPLGESPTPSPTPAASSTPAASFTPAASPTPADPTAAAAGSEQKTASTLLWIVLGISGIIVVAAGTVAVVVLVKAKRQKKRRMDGPL